MYRDKPLIKEYGKGSPRVVVVGSLHGDEPVGARIIKAIEKHPLYKGTLITIVGNPVALQKGVRYIAQDLNRCFPGKKTGSHEEKLAHQIEKIIRHADYCIDIHSTSTNTRRAAIIKKKNVFVKKLLSLCVPEHVVIMPKGVGDGSLINFCKAGVSLEYGKHQSRQTYTESLRDTLLVLENLGMIQKTRLTKKPWKISKYYSVYGTEPKPESFIMRKSILNFELIKKGDVLGKVSEKEIFAKESFYPVLFGGRSYKEIMGFKAKRLESL